MSHSGLSARNGLPCPDQAWVLFIEDHITTLTPTFRACSRNLRTSGPGSYLSSAPRAFIFCRLSAPGMAVGDPVDAALGQEIERFHVSLDRLLRVGALLHLRVPAAGHGHQPEPRRAEDGRGHGHHGVRLGLQGKVLRFLGLTGAAA